MISSRRFLAVALVALQWQAEAFSFSSLQSRSTRTTSLWSTTEKASTASSTSGGQEVILNEEKFIEEMEQAIPGLSEKPATTIWEEAEHRMAALATKGRALQQKYAVEISELRSKGVHDDFPERVPLSNSAVWREEPDVPVSAKGGVKKSAVAPGAGGSSGSGLAIAGVAALAGAAFVFTLAEPAMVSDALSRFEIPADASKVVEEVQASVDATVSTLGQAQDSWKNWFTGQAQQFPTILLGQLQTFVGGSSSDSLVQTAQETMSELSP